MYVCQDACSENREAGTFIHSCLDMAMDEAVGPAARGLSSD